MTRQVRAAADALCGGKLVLVQEGGYSEAYVPFYGLATIEELAGHRTPVQDPLLEMLILQHPPAGTQRMHDARADELTRLLTALDTPQQSPGDR